MALKSVAGIVLIVCAQICINLAQPTCKCERKYAPVCGSDHLTYYSACALECARDSSHLELSVAMQRPCYGNNIAGECGCSLDYTPVCGSDRYTYPNVCHLDCMAGRTSMWKITKAYEGECTRSPDDPNCNCAREWSPVCGSDEVTYDNECLLDCAAKKDSSLKLAYNFNCNPLLKFYQEQFGDDEVQYPSG